MKTLVFTAALFISVVSVASAQDDRNFWLGPYFTIGGSVSVGNVADGAKTDFKTAWSAGANGMYDLGSGMAIVADLGYDARQVNFHKHDDQNYKYNWTFNYLAFRPSIMFSNFMIGLGLGIPVGGSSEVQIGAGQPSGTATYGASGMNTLVELRLGGSIPLYGGDNSQLRFRIEGSYAFTDIVTSGPLPYFDATQRPVSTDNNGPLASVQLGVDYLFNLTHK